MKANDQLKREKEKEREMNPAEEQTVEEEVYHALENGKWPKVLRLIKESDFDGNKAISSCGGDSIVGWCAYKGRDTILEKMFECGKAKPTISEFNLTISKRHFRAARAFVEAGADVNAVPDREYTPLMQAVGSGSLSIFQLLLENGAKPDIRDFHGRNAMDVIYIDAKDFPLEKAHLFRALLKQGVTPTPNQVKQILFHASDERYGSKYLTNAVQAFEASKQQQ